MKSRECQEACKSLQELQNELMRKSMHVGSLAFAVEGQVKEKTKWFSLLRDLTRKLKIMKMEQIELSKIATDYKKCLSDFSDMSSIIQSTISREVDLHHDLRVKFIEASKDRKILYNKVLELKGNIRVFCRSRPLNADEIASAASMAIDFESAKNGELLVKSSGVSKKVFKFDAVFSPEADQAEVFQDTAPLVSSVLDGYNVCIFAYGQTGTGKTYTMVGTEEARGVNYMTLDELFRLMKNMEHQYQYEVSVSVLEVYNEQIRDLLVSGTQPGISTKRLEIRQVGDGVHHVPGLVEARVKNMSEVWEVLQAGSNARAVGATNANEYSSRSHCMHCVMVKSKNLLNGECTRSKLWLVDLAGSERIAKTEVQGERLKEAQNINRSLSALGDVISALATKSPHVPFRNSKLTHLLQDSLGGDSKALMFVQISPTDDDLSETLCSLNFACRVRGVELGPAKKQVDTTEFLKYKQMELKSKDAQVNKMDDVISNLDFRWKETNMKNKLLLEKVKELEMQLHIERKIAQQNTDSKQAGLQQQIRQQQEHATAAARPPLASRPLGLYKNISDQQGETLCKEQANGPGSFAQNNCYKSSDPLAPNTGLVKHIDMIEKENNPDLGELKILPQRTGRASSICMTARRATILSNPRRNSLMPLPNIPTSTQVTTPFLPMHPTRTNDLSNGGYQAECFPQPISEDSPRGLRSGGKKLNSILRRSLQKKIQIKPVIRQQMRKGGVNVGEKIRLSIQGRGRMARRVLLGNNGGRRPDSATLHKHIQEKEKGWNIGTGGRNLL
uniref:Kinesin-like protein n=1 Tax=Kalanchoe fedtschenkoi TaxID=63787 RepID=A0A7N1A438_KALFE